MRTILSSATALCALLLQTAQVCAGVPSHHSDNKLPFQSVAELDDASYFRAINGSFFFSQDTCSSNCGFNPNGTVFMLDGMGHVFLDVGVPGGQQVYALPTDGSLHYTPPGKPTDMPAGAITSFFDRIHKENNLPSHWGYRPIQAGRPVFDIMKWAACRTKGTPPHEFADGKYFGGRIFIDSDGFQSTHPSCSENPYTRSYGYTVRYTGPQPAVYSYP